MASEKLGKFVTETAYPYLNKLLLFKSKTIYEQLNELKGRYLTAFKEAFLGVQSFNRQTGKEAAYVSFTLLRLNLLREKYKYEVHVYDKDWYLNDYVKTGEIDVTDLFFELKEVKEFLFKESKKWVGKVNISDVENTISLHLPLFNKFFIKMFRSVQAEVTECAEYEEIKKADEFNVYAGELYGEPYILHSETKSKMDLETIKEKISSNKSCENLDLRNSDFSEEDISNSDMRFSDFRNSRLKGVNLSNSKLLGTLFKNCDLSEANLSGTTLNEVSFQGANLRNTNLSKSASCEGFFFTLKGVFPCNFPLNLKGADMRNSIIRNSIFINTDFTEARLDGIDFTDTSFNGCKFTKAQLSTVSLTDTQLTQIVII